MFTGWSNKRISGFIILVTIIVVDCFFIESPDKTLGLIALGFFIGLLVGVAIVGNTIE